MRYVTVDHGNAPWFLNGARCVLVGAEGSPDEGMTSLVVQLVESDRQIVVKVDDDGNFPGLVFETN